MKKRALLKRIEELEEHSKIHVHAATAARLRVLESRVDTFKKRLDTIENDVFRIDGRVQVMSDAFM